MANRYFTFTGWYIPTLLGAFVLIGAFAAFDLLMDLSEGTTPRHVVTEGAVFLLALAGIVVLTSRLVGEIRVARLEAAELSRSLSGSREEATQWRKEAQSLLQGLGAQIDQQLSRWKLTTAEKEVALLLLKGYSHKELAHFRKVSEATARQQARAVYKKAGVSGRHDLAAFFLEELALPSPSPQQLTPTNKKR